MSAAVEFPRRHAVSAAEYLRMGEAGVFAPDARLELIEGEIIDMAPIGPPHAWIVSILTRTFVQRAGEAAITWVQCPVRLHDLSIPQPDLALLRPRRDNDRRSHPTAADILLAVEVSDSTLAFDLRVKAPLYARCGIPELWIVDVNGRAVRVHRDPRPEGYATSSVAKGNESVACAALPRVHVEVRELFEA